MYTPFQVVPPGFARATPYHTVTSQMVAAAGDVTTNIGVSVISDLPAADDWATHLQAFAKPLASLGPLPGPDPLATLRTLLSPLAPTDQPDNLRLFPPGLSSPPSCHRRVKCWLGRRMSRCALRVSLLAG